MTPWLELLHPIRTRLSGRDHRGYVGSLRWLERVMTERGGRAGTVRNILYKGAGATEEKLRLFEVVSELYEVAGLPPPTPPQSLTTAKAKRLLGRDKRRIFNRFVRSVRAGEVERLVVVGGPATGKGMLLEQLKDALPHSLTVNLARELSPALFKLAEQLGVTGEFERLLARLSAEQPFALQASLQQDVLRLLVDGLNRQGLPLLLRAEAEATLSTLCLRDRFAHEVDLPTWLMPLLEGAGVSYVAALAASPGDVEHWRLRPPTREEARSYLRQLVPDAPPERVETMLNRGGRSYGELSRLALLETSRGEVGGEAQLMGDPQLGALLRILAALSPEADPAVPARLLEEALGKPLTALSPAERALVEPVGGEPVGGEREDGFAWRPAVRAFLPAAPDDPDLHALALAFYRRRGGLYRQLYHARHARAWEELLSILEEDASRLALMPALWSESRTWPHRHRERLAFLVVRYRSVLGDYVHPEAREALALLRASENVERSAWARVKMAEGHIDAGRFQAAEELVNDLPGLSGEAQVEAILISAAFARWRGAYEEARQLVASALEVPAPPLLEDRVRLWQGLVAKDAGLFSEALASLEKVHHSPLLAGRARYQEGDLLTRLGHPREGEERIRAAVELLRDHAPHEERVRVQARLGTPLRRLGRYGEASAALYAALDAVSEPFTRARIASETSILEAAAGNGWQALRLAAEAEVAFRATAERPEEAAYRHRRTVFRLAAALWVRDTGEPYRPPFRGTGRSGSGAARPLLEDLVRDVAPLAQEADRDASLLIDAVQLLALISPPREALALLDATEVPQREYLEVQRLLSRAEALLRMGDASAAAATLAGLRDLPPDPGIVSWKGALEAEMQLLLGREELACRIMAEQCAQPAAFRSQLGHVWGRVLCERDRRDLAAEWLHDGELLPLPDGLALRFEEGGT